MTPRHSHIASRTSAQERSVAYRARGAVARILCLLALVHAPVAASQEQWNVPRDYYQAHAGQAQTLLSNVEKHHLQQGIDRMTEGRYDRAREEFDFILRYFPNHPRGLLLMSELSLKAGKPGQAHPYFNKALTLYPDHAVTYSIYGIFLQRSGDIEEAVEQYIRALERNPEASETHYNLGLAYLEIGETSKAKEHAVRAYELGYPLPGLRDQLTKAGIW